MMTFLLIIYGENKGIPHPPLHPWIPDPFIIATTQTPALVS